MVSTATILCITFTLLVSLVLPAAVLILFAAKYKKQGIVSSWFLGAAGFFVTQILIRVPILTALQSQPWFLTFSQQHLFLYAFSLAFTAGLFELAGRFAVAKLMKNRTYRCSLAAGLGHGGIEAMVIVGVAMINNLAYVAMINSGTFDTVLAETAALGVDVSQLELVKAQLIATSPALFLLSGFERILCMISHAAMSMLVCYGIAHKKALRCTLVCLGIHVFMDLTAGLTLILPQTTAYFIIYPILIAAAALSLWILTDIRRRWQALPQKEETL